MKQLPYIPTSTAIIGYSDSSIAKSEKNDCFVRAVASAYEIPYDEAHEWVRVNFKRVPQKGTLNVISNMDSYAAHGVKLNDKKVSVIQELRTWDVNKFKVKRTTLNQFMKKYTTGTYILIVRGHAFTLKNGAVVGNKSDSSSLKKIVHNAYQIS